MRTLLAVCLSIGLLIALTGCTVASVDGRDITVVAAGITNTNDVVDEYYEGLFSGCVQSFIVNIGKQKLSPEVNTMIVRQCMVLTATAIKNDSHKSGVPGWPGVKEIRKVLKEIEGGDQLDLLGATEL